MKRSFLAIVVLLWELSACNVLPTTQATATPTATIPPPTPTPVATFPPIGEWEYMAPYSLLNDAFALVLDIQQANSTTSVASLTSIGGECVWKHDPQGNNVMVSQTYTDAESASDTISGTDITVTANISYWSGRGRLSLSSVNFEGVINPDGSLSLASSGLHGVQDYLFTTASGAVAQIQRQFQQDKCS